VPPPPTKKINVVVRKHVVKVPTGKPTNGGSGVENPVPVQNLRKGFFSRCVDIVKSDIQTKILRTEATLQEPDVSFEDYVRFLEMAKKK
jgi:hypothetical protein